MVAKKKPVAEIAVVVRFDCLTGTTTFQYGPDSFKVRNLKRMTDENFLVGEQRLKYMDQFFTHTVARALNRLYGESQVHIQKVPKTRRDLKKFVLSTHLAEYKAEIAQRLDNLAAKETRSRATTPDERKSMFAHCSNLLKSLKAAGEKPTKLALARQLFPAHHTNTDKTRYQLLTQTFRDHEIIWDKLVKTIHPRRRKK